MSHHVGFPPIIECADEQQIAAESLRQCADADADAGSGMLRACPTAPDRWRASIFPGSPFCGSHMFRPDDQSLSLQASH
jgi:hypothetical protein